MEHINTSHEQEESQALANATTRVENGDYVDDQRPEVATATGLELLAYQQAMRQAPSHIQAQHNYSPSQEVSSIRSIKMIRPFTKEGNPAATVKFRKTTVIWEVQTTGEAFPAELLAKKLLINYGEEGEEKVGLPTPQLQEEGRYQLELDLELPENFTNGKIAKISFLNYTFGLRYSSKGTEELNNPEEAQQFIKNNKRWSSTQLLVQDSTTLLALLPDIEHEERSYGVLVDVSQVLTGLAAHPLFSTPLRAEDLANQGANEVKTRYNANVQQLQLLESLLSSIAAKDEALEDFPANYEGGQEAQVFGEDYQATLASNNQVQATLMGYLTRCQEERQLLRATKRNLEIPTELREKTKDTQQLREQLEEQLSILEERVKNYKEEELSFEEWKNNLLLLDQELQALQNQWAVAFSTLETAITDYEEQKQGEQLGRAYRSWKKEAYQPMTRQATNMQSTATFLQQQLEAQRAVIEQTGGDGVLEYKAGENKVDDTEKAAFGKNGKTLSFKTPETKLYDGNGIQATDVNQGGVGDCYLLACLATLAQGESKQLIKQAIVDKGTYFEVTLYKAGVPVKIGVDRAMLYVEQETGDGGKREGYLGASPEQELWVAIIEKAYAKLESGGSEADYSKIELNTTQYAYSVLLGPQQQSPNEIYLDEQGNLSDQRTARVFQNPLPLQETAPEDIAALAQACAGAGYKMTVSSPDSFDGLEGLTHDHVVSLGDKKYMHLQHAYGVLGVEEKTIELLNPHGKNAGKDRQTYSPKLKEIARELELALEQLEEDLKASKNKKFSKESKEKVDAAFLPFYLDDKKENEDAGYNNDVLRKLYSAWGKIIGIAEQEGAEWKVQKKHIKSIEKTFLKKKQKLVESAFRKGFTEKRKIAVSAKQKISFEVLGAFFQGLTILNIR